MTEKKTDRQKSFVMYNDWGNNLDEFTNEELGQLFRAVYAFTTKGEETELGDRSLRIFFNMMKECFIRDAKKWEEIRRQRSIAGAKGGRPKKANKANGFSQKQTKAKKAVNVNGNVNVNDNVSVNVNEDVNENVIEDVYVNEDEEEDVNVLSELSSSSSSSSRYTDPFLNYIH